MKFEIGKEYLVSNYYKKSYVEIEFWHNPETNQWIHQEIGWRSGEVFITPMSDEECEELSKAFENIDYELDLSSFEECEFSGAFDGCWEDWRSTDVKDIAERYEAFESDDKFFSFEEVVESMGFEREEIEAYFCAGIVAEEVDPENKYFTFDDI